MLTNTAFGTYQVIWHETEKNKKLGTSFNLFNDKVPSKRLILIHIGNIPDHSEGCLLFGSTKGNNTKPIKYSIIGK